MKPHRKPRRSSNIFVGERRTSARLNPLEIKAIAEIAKIEDCFKHEIYKYVDRSRDDKTSLTAAIRNFIIRYYQEAATDVGHRKAGHGYLIRNLKSSP